MLIPSRESQIHQRIILINQCNEKVNRLLEFGDDYFHQLFPNATISVTSSGIKSCWPATQVIKHKINHIRSLLTDIMDMCSKICEGEEDYEFSDDPVQLPDEIKRTIFKTCVNMLVYGRDLGDSEYYFLSDLGRFLSIETSILRSVVEQTLYEHRKSTFDNLIPYLSERQKEICAMLLIKAIKADNKIHAAEIKYFEIVSNLLQNDQGRLEQIYDSFISLEKELPMYLPSEIAEFLFKYLVEIVMCDEEYDPEETVFIKEIGKAFNMDSHQQDVILQPITAALMVKSSLFN